MKLRFILERSVKGYPWSFYAGSVRVAALIEHFFCGQLWLLKKRLAIKDDKNFQMLPFFPNSFLNLLKRSAATCRNQTRQPRINANQRE
jgi:hypothetical protein